MTESFPFLLPIPSSVISSFLPFLFHFILALEAKTAA
jgi:hypothetical protein